MKLEGQVAIVTGAGRNIGERIAEVLAGEGARIAVVDLDRGRAEQAARTLADAGREAEAFVADVSDNESVRSLVAAVVERFGRIDILVNNVAISDNRHVLEITEKEWDDTIRVTLKSPFLMAKHVAHHMVDNGIAGKIVNIGSTSGYRGRGSACAYSAAKGGVANLTRSLAFQLAPHGIRVNSVSPNRTGSPVGIQEVDPNRYFKNLVNRAGVPDDTAQVVAFLCTDGASFICGENIFADGGVMAMEAS